MPLTKKNAAALSLWLVLLFGGDRPAVAWVPGLDETVQGNARLATQRERFVAAGRALAAGRLSEFRDLAAELQDYPLYPYLRFDYLRRNLSRIDAREIEAFLQEHASTPPAERLRRSWLHHLARHGRWERYIETFHADSASTELECHYATALMRTGRERELWEQVERLWLVGVSQPDACDPAFDHWREKRRMTRDHVLERIGLAMGRGQLGLVSHLAEFLGEQDRRWVRRWQRMHRHERRELARLRAQADSEWAALLFSYGIRRLALSDAAEAERLWRERRSRFEMTNDQVAQTERVIALESAYQRRPSAASRLASLSPEVSDGKIRQWRVRAALWQGDWSEVLAGLDAMEPDERREEEWQYWRARALEALGRIETAQAIYADVAECRCYHGFLAAERIGADPAINAAPLDVSVPQLTRMARRAAMRRAQELHALERFTDARREWRDAITRMDDDQLRAAAKLADLWGWHDWAILTLGRTDTLDDLELRFPTPFQEQVAAAAGQRELDIAFVYAVMRQESAFYPMARSSAGALGLMQLMPATARQTARQINRRVSNIYDILAVENNITLGVAHLSHLLNRYEGNVVYTMAAYNAGPGRVSSWQAKAHRIPADVWIASIPYRETRGYIERILAYTRIYEWRLGRDLTPMSHHLEGLNPGRSDSVAESPLKGWSAAG